ncbi:RNA methyltransferase PUA domain-containing protein, partial [Pseudonocardia benzenivorans]
MGTAPLFLVDELPAGPDAVLDGPEGRHAATVRRLRPGEEITLADGRGGLARAVVDTVGRDRLDVRVLDRAELEPPTPRVTLAQALV